MGQLAGLDNLRVIPNINLDFWYYTNLQELEIPRSREFYLLLEIAQQTRLGSRLKKARAIVTAIFTLSR
ncbi:MAG: hypothetical protein ACOY9Y_10125 [Bacillota bacterium]